MSREPRALVGHGDDGRVGHAVEAHQRGLDLAGRDHCTVYLDAGVEPAEVFEHAVVAPSAPIRGAEALAPVGLAEEAGGGELRVAPVPTGDVSVADDHDATWLAVGDQFAVVVHQLDGDAGSRGPHRDRAFRELDAVREVPGRDATGFGRGQGVPQCRVGTDERPRGANVGRVEGLRAERQRPEARHRAWCGRVRERTQDVRLEVQLGDLRTADPRREATCASCAEVVHTQAETVEHRAGRAPSERP